MLPDNVWLTKGIYVVMFRQHIYILIFQWQITHTKNNLNCSFYKFLVIIKIDHKLHPEIKFMTKSILLDFEKKATYIEQREKRSLTNAIDSQTL